MEKVEKQIKKGTSRRDFLRGSAAVLAGFTIVPRHVLGKGFIAPSDQLTKGIIGVGGMGQGHIAYGGTRVVAICDVDQNHLKNTLAKLPKGVKAMTD
ncbi:MAG: twin-arginine translocation signal domain-containing protein, partial [Spirosomataceae bacterium]